MQYGVEHFGGDFAAAAGAVAVLGQANRFHLGFLGVTNGKALCYSYSPGFASVGETFGMQAMQAMRAKEDKEPAPPTRREYLHVGSHMPSMACDGRLSRSLCPP
ncbi:hypothetical protein GCM10007082_11110 [Oceanisphaera arctica]|nr:hypothetical protein GCM10007082_11110 [Oceanisphaera arctica]